MFISPKNTVYPYIIADINKTQIVDLQLSLWFTFATLSFEIFFDLKPKHLVETFESLYNNVMRSLFYQNHSKRQVF